MLGIALTLCAAVIVAGLVLREHGPGNMGTGPLVGAGIGMVAVGVGLWSITRRPKR